MNAKFPEMNLREAHIKYLEACDDYDLDDFGLTCLRLRRPTMERLQEGGYVIFRPFAVPNGKWRLTPIGREALKRWNKAHATGEVYASSAKTGASANSQR